MVAIKGRVVRATGRDRHSKVYTARGPKDRRVRLSAGTAIQFYDVQDRLGYDRPSEAVDWLIHKAKASIEALPHKGNVNPVSVGVRFGSFEENPLQDMECGGQNAAPAGCQQKNQDFQHFDLDYHMEKSMAEWSSTFGSFRSAECVMFEEENMMSLPPLNQQYFDQVVLNTSDCQKVVSSNHKFSSRAGNQLQVCSSMSAPIWGEPMFRLPAFPGTTLSFRDSTKACDPTRFPTSK